MFYVELCLLQILIAKLFVVEVEFEILEILEYLLLGQIFQFKEVVFQWILLFVLKDGNLQFSCFVDVNYSSSSLLLQLR